MNKKFTTFTLDRKLLGEHAHPLSVLLNRMDKLICRHRLQFDMTISKSYILDDEVFIVSQQIFNHLPISFRCSDGMVIKSYQDDDVEDRRPDERFILLKQLFDVVGQITNKTILTIEIIRDITFRLSYIHDTIEEAIPLLMIPVYDRNLGDCVIDNTDDENILRWLDLYDMAETDLVRFIPYPDGLQRNVIVASKGDLLKDIKVLETFVENKNNPGFVNVYDEDGTTILGAVVI